MRYTEQSIRADLARLNIVKWDWAGVNPGKVRAHLRRNNPHIGRGGSPARDQRSFQEELAEYCWCAYSKSLNSGGDMVIGRVKDLDRAGLYSKVAEIVKSTGDTLFSGGTQGNLLEMDKWAKAVNDSWILGGVHRRAKFRLASPRTLDNLWNAGGGYLVVTAREILGLLHFGYEFQQIGPWRMLLSRSLVKSTTADLCKYERHIQRRSSLATAISLQDP